MKPSDRFAPWHFPFYNYPFLNGMVHGLVVFVVVCILLAALYI